MSQELPPADSQEPQNEDLKILVTEAVNELQRDQLKQELLKKIRDAERKTSIGKLAAHPAVLVFIGFILTGFFGTLITSRWQRAEWDRQQQRLIQIRSIEQKEKVMEELTQALADSNETEENVLISFSPEWRAGDPRREAITRERLEAWRAQGGRSWRVATELIRGKLAVYFKVREDKNDKDELLKIFNGVLDRRDDIAYEITQLESEYNKNPAVRSDLSFIEHRKQIAADVEKNRNDLRRMIDVILEDIQRDIAAPRTLWWDSV
jgi:hypothetical protein